MLFPHALEYAFDETREFRFEFRAPNPVHQDGALPFGNDHAAFAQNPKVMREGRFGHVDAEHTAGLFTGIVELPNDFEPHGVGERLKNLHKGEATGL